MSALRLGVPAAILLAGVAAGQSATVRASVDSSGAEANGGSFLTSNQTTSFSDAIELVVGP